MDTRQESMSQEDWVESDDAWDEVVGPVMDENEKPATCMHSFFAIGGDQMKCTFCGVGK